MKSLTATLLALGTTLALMAPHRVGPRGKDPGQFCKTVCGFNA